MDGLHFTQILSGVARQPGKIFTTLVAFELNSAFLQRTSPRVQERQARPGLSALARPLIKKRKMPLSIINCTIGGIITFFLLQVPCLSAPFASVLSLLRKIELIRGQFSDRNAENYFEIAIWLAGWMGGWVGWC